MLRSVHDLSSKLAGQRTRCSENAVHSPFGLCRCPEQSVPMTPPISPSTVHFTSSRRHRLYHYRAYRPSSSIYSGAGRISEQGFDFSSVSPSFEILTRAHPFRYALATFFASCGSIHKIATSFFGLIPENSLLDKCPYYRTASEESTPNLPASLKWVADVEGRGLSGKKRSEIKIDSSLVGYRKRYRRDRLTLPAMVVVYNTALVWMMFNIEMRASSL